MIRHSALFIAALATAAAAALGFPTPTASAGRAVRAVVSESPIRASVDAPRLDGSVGIAMSPQPRWTIARASR